MIRRIMKIIGKLLCSMASNGCIMSAYCSASQILLTAGQKTLPKTQRTTSGPDSRDLVIRVGGVQFEKNRSRAKFIKSLPIKLPRAILKAPRAICGPRAAI